MSVVGEASRRRQEERAQAKETAAHAPKPDPASSALVAGMLAGQARYSDATKDAPKAKGAESPKQKFERLKAATEAAYRDMVEAETKDERIERLLRENQRLSHVAMLLERRANELEITVRSQASLIGPPQYQEQQQAPPPIPIEVAAEPDTPAEEPAK